MSLADHPTLPAWRAAAPPGISLAAAMTRAAAAAPPRPGRLPAELARVLRPEAAPRWRASRISQWTPQQVEWTLANALAGDLVAQWELFDLMEETWPRLAKALAELRRAITSQRWAVRPWYEEGEAPSPEAGERARLVSHVLWRMRPDPAAGELGFTGILHDLLDAWGKGISLIELLWEEREAPGLGRFIAVRAGQWVPPHHYTITPDGGLGLKLAGRREPITPPPYKFIIAIARARTTHWAGAALLRPLAWWWAAANFSAEWLLNYAQLFGVPLRWAQYPHTADEALVARIGDALANLGSAGWAAFPEGTALQLFEGQKTAGSSPQEGIIERADRYCDLLILGQTLTSDAADRGTQALGTVHERVRADVIRAASDWLASILNEQLVPAILELNYGDADWAPEIRAEPIREKDYEAQARRDQILLSAGVPLPRAWFYERHDIPLPAPDEEVIGGPAPPLPPDGSSSAEGLQAARGVSPDPPSDAIAAEKAAALAAAYRGALAPIKDLILSARSPQEAFAAVAAHFRDWRPEKVIALTEEALSLAAAAGAAATVRGRRR